MENICMEGPRFDCAGDYWHCHHGDQYHRHRDQHCPES